MAISTEKKVWTDTEFMALPKDGHRYELVNGALVDTGNSGMEHGYIACILTIVLGGVEPTNLEPSVTPAQHLHSKLEINALLIFHLLPRIACKD